MINKVSLTKNAQPINKPNMGNNKNLGVIQPLRVNLLKDNSKKPKLDIHI